MFNIFKAKPEGDSNPWDFVEIDGEKYYKERKVSTHTLNKGMANIRAGQGANVILRAHGTSVTVNFYELEKEEG